MCNELEHTEVSIENARRMTLLIRRISEFVSLPSHPSYVRTLILFFLLGKKIQL